MIKLLAAAEWIDPAKMAERRPLHFTTSDGMQMEAILTLPPDHKLENLPMVLLPHGGPIGVQDDWYYDDDAQFLASRGYLVLQVNYRGSSGRGVDFEEAACSKWGTRVQQDSTTCSGRFRSATLTPNASASTAAASAATRP